MNAFNAPFSNLVQECTISPIKIASNLAVGNIINLTSISGNVCHRYWPRANGNCKSSDTRCYDAKTNNQWALIGCNHPSIKIGFYDYTKNPPVLIKEYTAAESLYGVKVPNGANSAYSYFVDEINTYFDNNGYQRRTYSYTVTKVNNNC
jgi:hypothetical protein